MHVTPLLAISGALLDAVGESVIYQSVADGLLTQAVALDDVYRDAIVGEFQGIENVTQTFVLRPDRIDRRRARRVFDKIREYKDTLLEDVSLMEHVSLLKDVFAKMDDMAHFAANSLPVFDRDPRLVGSVHNAQRNHITYIEVARSDIRYALRHYLGLAPDPVFGANVAYTDARVIDTLTPYGFGASVFLNLSLHPDSIESGQLASRLEIGEISRPVATAAVTEEADGTIRLGQSA